MEKNPAGARAQCVCVFSIYQSVAAEMSKLKGSKTLLIKLFCRNFYNRIGDGYKEAQKVRGLVSASHRLS